MAIILRLPLFVLLLSLAGKYLLAQECPQPSVRKRTIIRAKESRENGAAPIGKFVVDSARQCYIRCCKESACNVAIMYYKQVIENEQEITEKHCFLFDCKSPSVCTYDNHERYAVIEVPKSGILHTTDSELDKLSSAYSHQPTSVAPTSSTTTKMQKKFEEKCPPDAPVAMCSGNPCKGKTCKEHTNAICKPSFCGGCFAKFYDHSGKKLLCTVESKKKNEEVVNVASTDYQETPEDTLPAPSSLVGTTKDPYFQSERRKWIGGDNPGHLLNGTQGANTISNNGGKEVKEKKKERVIVVNNSFMSIPVFIALCICILLIVGLIYRFKFTSRGKPKKVPVDDGDYLINGMYL